MSERRDDEFYVGYLPTAPSGVARRVRTASVALLAGATIVAAVLVVGQKRWQAGTFEFLEYRTFEGTVRETPYPSLEVTRPGAVDESGTSRYLLVAPGKFGANAEVSGFDGRTVRLEGSLVYRDGDTMIEVVPGSAVVVSDDGARASRTTSDAAETVTLLGEIVDSKCFLGVMSPGNAKPHRACATRCIAGGVPPLFVVTGGGGNPTTMLLVAPDGSPVNDAVLDLVAEPVQITGRLVRDGERLVLMADPATYRRTG